MKKVDVGQAITILANLGVIAGIVFLAIEIQQNNDQLRIQARQNVYEMQAEIQRNFYRNDGGLAELYIKAVQGESLSFVESVRFTSYQTHLIRTMAFIFREDPEAANESIDWMAMFFTGPGMLDVWEDMRSDYSAEFVEFIEQSVLTDR